jgi:hypothetical protein
MAAIASRRTLSASAITASSSLSTPDTTCLLKVLSSASSAFSWAVRCHTLKYLILGCEYLLQCVYLPIGFFENFKDFLVIILFILELDPFILLFGKL